MASTVPTEFISPHFSPLALCFGLSKPTNLDFLDDVVGDLCSVMENGLDRDSGLIRIKLFCVRCDAPAKALVMPMKLYSGHQVYTKRIVGWTMGDLS